MRHPTAKAYPIGFTPFQLDVMMKLLDGKELHGYELIAAKRIRAKLNKTAFYVKGEADIWTSASA